MKLIFDPILGQLRTQDSSSYIPPDFSGIEFPNNPIEGQIFLLVGEVNATYIYFDGNWQLQTIPLYSKPTAPVIESAEFDSTWNVLVSGVINGAWCYLYEDDVEVMRMTALGETNIFALSDLTVGTHHYTAKVSRLENATIFSSASEVFDLVVTAPDAPVIDSATCTPLSGENVALAGTVTGTEGREGAYGPELAFNGSIEPVDRWFPSDANAPTAYAVVHLAQAETVTSYGMWTIPPGTGSGWTITGWTLSGSNNGTDWTVLDVQSGLTWAEDEHKVFQIASPASYEYYKISNCGSETSSFIIQDCELNTTGSSNEGCVSPAITVSGVQALDVVTLYDGETMIDSQVANDTTHTFTAVPLNTVGVHSLTAKITRGGLVSETSEVLAFEVIV